MCGKSFVKPLLVLLSLLVMLTGCALLGIGIWTRLDLQSVTVLFGSFPTLFENISNFVIAVGVLLFVLGFAGFLGAWKEYKLLLKIFVVLTMLMFLLEVAIIIAVLVFNNDIRGYLGPPAVYTIENNYVSSVSTLITEAWDFIQIRFNCCGFNGGSDYVGSLYDRSTDYLQPWPLSCCARNSDGGYINVTSCLDGSVNIVFTNAQQGCAAVLIPTIRFYFIVVGYVVASFLVLHQFTMLLAIVLSQRRSLSYSS